MGELGQLGELEQLGQLGQLGQLVQHLGFGVRGSTHLRYEGPLASQIQLLIVQPTPFCNIDCDYCYLPDRNQTHRLSRETFRLLLEKVFASGLAGGQLSLVWHSGEPLVLPVSYYSNLLDTVDELGIPRPRIRQSIQTNAMLLNRSVVRFHRLSGISTWA